MPCIVANGRRLSGKVGQSLRRVAITGVLGLSACATAVTSVEAPDSTGSDGIVYWLPKKQILVTLTVGDDDTGDTVEVTSAPAYPDYTHRFVLRPGTNLAGTQKLAVTVDARGLLQTVNGDTTSLLPEALTNLAASLGAARAGLTVAAEVERPCAKGVYKRLLDPVSVTSTPLCDYTIGVQAGDRPAKDGKTEDGKTEDGKTEDGKMKGEQRTQEELRPCSQLGPYKRLKCGTREDGVFYRQELPYFVTVRRKEEVREFLAFSPTHSPVMFLPMGHAAFANNVVKVTFTDGALSGADVTRGGELVALFKLPADLLGAYFGAIGNIFGQRKVVDEKQAEMLAARDKLLVEQLRNENCRAAIASEKALDQIKAACGVQ